MIVHFHGHLGGPPQHYSLLHSRGTPCWTAWLPPPQCHPTPGISSLDAHIPAGRGSRHLLAASSIRHTGTHQQQRQQQRMVTSMAAGSKNPWFSSSAMHLTVAPLQPGEVFYLGFGSNMNPKVLQGRRAVRPKQSLPCYLPGFQLSFGVQGFPWVEPGFATITSTAAYSSSNSSSRLRRAMQPDGTPACLHGVLHRVTRREWALIKASEGVSETSSSTGVGYQVVEVNCLLYDDITVIKALTLQAAAASLHHPSRQALPSARYLRLLQEGARFHGLDSHYQSWLGSLNAYTPPSSIQAALGALASGAVLASAATTAVPAYLASRALGLTTSTSQPAAPSSPAGIGTGSEANGDMSSSNGNAAAGESKAAVTTQSGSQQGSNTSSLYNGRHPQGDAGLFGFVRSYMNTSQSLAWQLHDAVRAAGLLSSGCNND